MEPISTSELEIIDLGNDIFLSPFEHQEDMENVLVRTPRFLFGHYLLLTSFKTMILCIRFLALPIQYYGKKSVFCKIAAVVGKTLKMYHATN